MQAYATAAAFRQALENRLLNQALAEGVDLHRLRRQVAFDRLLCRLFQQPTAPWLLKGGYAMELRLAAGRTTRDVDLALCAPIVGAGKITARILTMLQEAAAADLGDFFAYTLGGPLKELGGAPYGGARYSVEARLAGRVFSKFHLDVGAGDVVLGPADAVHGRDWLGFAGIPARAFPSISKEQQFAEKLHAYTLPRGATANTRVRDLVDMYLLVQLGLIPIATRAALIATFNRRAVHVLENTLPPPPHAWEQPFAALASDCGFGSDLAAAFKVVADFYATLHVGEEA
jgi:hypothetical protein